MCASSLANEGNRIPKLSNSQELHVRIFELPDGNNEKKLSNLINELNSKGLLFSFRITKTSQLLLLYNSNQSHANEERQENLVSNLLERYSLEEKEVSDGIFISNIRKVEQDGKIISLQHEDNSYQYVLACLLSVVDTHTHTIKRNFTDFMKNIVNAEIFSLVVTQFTSSNNSSRNSPAWGLFLIARSENKDVIKDKEKTLQRYLKANQIKLNSQLLFLSKKDVVRHMVNFRYYVPWLKHSGLMNDIIDLSKFFRIKVELPVKKAKSKEEKRLQTEVIQPNPTTNTSQNDAVFSPEPSSKKPFPSVKRKVTPIPSSTTPGIETTKTEENQYTLSNIDDLDVPSPRSVNMVFDAEYLKVRISKVFKEFEFKETMIFEDNFDLVLRKGTYYVFVKFFKTVLNQSLAHEIIEHLSSIAGLRNQFLCIVVADVVEENSKKLLNEYNILHLTLTDVLVNDSLKAKIYGTILA